MDRFKPPITISYRKVRENLEALWSNIYRNHISGGKAYLRVLTYGHLANLVISFVNVVLVDTNCIDPKPVSETTFPSLSQEVVQITPNNELLSIDKYLPGFILAAPRVG